MKTQQPMNRLAKLALGLVGVAMLGTGCMHTASTDHLKQVSETPQPMKEVRRPMQDALRDFGMMVQAYRPDAKEIVIEIDLVPNDSGVSEDLPRDLEVNLRSALSDMGHPIRTVQRYAVLRENTQPVQRYAPSSKRQNAHNHVDLVITGELQSVTEVINRDRSGNGNAAGGVFQRAFDIGGTMQRAVKLTKVRVTLMAEEPNGLSIPGGSATFDLYIGQNSRGASVATYLDGSGLGFASTVSVEQNPHDAINDLVGACAIKVIGCWLGLPYYRSLPMVLGTDRRMMEAQRVAMLAASDEVVERELRALIDPRLGQPVEAAINHGMMVRGLLPSNSVDRRAFAYQLWLTLDYRGVAKARRGERTRDDERAPGRFATVQEREAELDRQVAARREAAAAPQYQPAQPQPLPRPAQPQPRLADSNATDDAGQTFQRISQHEIDRRKQRVESDLAHWPALERESEAFGWPEGSLYEVDTTELGPNELKSFIDAAQAMAECHEIVASKARPGVYYLQISGLAETEIRRQLKVGDFASYDLLKVRTTGRPPYLVYFRKELVATR